MCIGALAPYDLLGRPAIFLSIYLPIHRRAKFENVQVVIARHSSFAGGKYR